jgi:hypothetical protein
MIYSPPAGVVPSSGKMSKISVISQTGIVTIPRTPHPHSPLTFLPKTFTFMVVVWWVLAE